MSYSLPTYFMVFLPVTGVCYQLAPQRHRWKVLLAASWVFFWSISHGLIVYLLVSILLMHYFGLWMDAIQKEGDSLSSSLPRAERKAVRQEYTKKQKSVLTLGIVSELGILLVLKYAGFFCANVGTLLKLLHCPLRLPVPAFAVPIGISFYTMQAMSYLWDVYHQRCPADRNLGRLALYMSFFPSLMEGPICRVSQTANALWEGKGITYHSLTFGVQRMLWGMAKKIILADRLDILVKNLFSDYSSADGGIIALGMVCYTYQLYMDFSGTIDIVIGSAEIFGISLPENFRQPFFSTSVSEFWRRWHITLGAWFRDYIFYPVSLSAPMKKLAKNGRKKLGNHFGSLCASSVALFFVWSCNGLWHGAAWSFIFFGMYHFFWILAENIAEPFTPLVLSKLHIEQNGTIWRMVQIGKTILLVNIGELFFRATTLTDGMAMFRKMVTNFTFASFQDGGYLKLGLDGKDFVVALVGMVIVWVVGCLHEKGISIREETDKLNLPLRWMIWYALLLALVLFGAYGSNYAPVDPIYAGF